jgi:hypothetical protein
MMAVGIGDYRLCRGIAPRSRDFRRGGCAVHEDGIDFPISSGMLLLKK